MLHYSLFDWCAIWTKIIGGFVVALGIWVVGLTFLLDVWRNIKRWTKKS